MAHTNIHTHDTHIHGYTCIYEYIQNTGEIQTEKENISKQT